MTTIPEDCISYFSYEKSGDSIGSKESIAITMNKKGKILLTKTYKEAANFNENKKTIMVPLQLLLDLSQLIHQYDITSWTNLEKNEICVMDAATTTIGFTINQKYIHFSSDDILPEENIIHMFLDVIIPYLN